MTTQTALQAAAGVNLSTVAANLGIFITFVAVTVAGIYAGIKKVKDGSADKTNQFVVAATILENQTLSNWSESNRSVVEALYSMRNEMRELRHEMELTRIANSGRTKR